MNAKNRSVLFFFFLLLLLLLLLLFCFFSFITIDPRRGAFSYERGTLVCAEGDVDDAHADARAGHRGGALAAHKDVLTDYWSKNPSVDIKSDANHGG